MTERKVIKEGQGQRYTRARYSIVLHPIPTLGVMSDRLRMTTLGDATCQYPSDRYKARACASGSLECPPRARRFHGGRMRRWGKKSGIPFIPPNACFMLLTRSKLSIYIEQILSLYLLGWYHWKWWMCYSKVKWNTGRNLLQTLLKYVLTLGGWGLGKKTASPLVSVVSTCAAY